MGKTPQYQRCCGELFEGFRAGVQLTDILILRERLRIQIPFKLGNEQGTRGIAENVDGGADHIEHTVDASDQGQRFQRDADLGEDEADHDKASPGDAGCADRGEKPHEHDGKLVAQGQRDAIHFGGENSRDAHINGGAVHIDGIAKRDGEAGNALGGPEAAYGLQVGGKGRRAGARRKGDEPRSKTPRKNVGSGIRTTYLTSGL